MVAMDLPALLTDWFATRGWSVRRHQREMLAAAAAGDHALLVAPTGSGKTLAGFLPTLADLIADPTDGLHTVYVSPLKALAVDVARNLTNPIAEMGLDVRVETRTGDTPSDRKARQRATPPQILLTTPESLSLLISYPDARRMLGGLKTVIVDEIHAFATTKRGDILNLAMSRLAALSPGPAPRRPECDDRRPGSVSGLARARRRRRQRPAGRGRSRGRAGYRHPRPRRPHSVVGAQWPLRRKAG